MDREKVTAMEEALIELEKYNYPFIQEKVKVLRDCVNPIIVAEKEKEFKVQRRLKYSWGNFDPNSRLQTMVMDLKSISKYHDEATEELKSYNNETQDILHALEFLENTEEEIKQMSEDLIEIRRNRRKAKNFLELSEPLYEFANQNRTFVDKLLKTSKNTQACFDKLERRTYTPREKTALAVAFEKLSEVSK